MAERERADWAGPPRSPAEIRGWARCALLCALLCVAFFWDVLGAPADHIVGGNDLANMFRIWLDFARDTLGKGELPLWNPYVFSGMSFVSDPQPAIFYPPTWLNLLFPTTRALGLIIVLHVWWSMVGTVAWLRSETDDAGLPLSWAGAYAGAVVFAFSGYVFARVQAGHIGVITTGAWLPWGLWALRRIVRRRDGPSIVLGGLCVAMAALAGHTATLIYLSILWLAYGLFTIGSAAPEARRCLLGGFAVAGLLGVGLAAIQLAPLLSDLLSSTRLAQSDYAFSARFSWPVGYLLTFLVPNFFGEPVRTGYWGDGVYEEMIYYVGILPLLLSWVAWRAGRRIGRSRQVLFWAAAAILALLSAFGSNGVVHRLLFRFLPGFSVMRAPARAGLILTCSAAALVAVALTALQGLPSEDRQALLRPFSKTGLTWKVPFVTVVLVMGSYLVYAFAKESNPEIGRFWHTAGQLAAFGLFFTLNAAYVHQWERENPWSWLAPLATGLILLDLWSFGAGLVTVVPTPPSAYWRIVAQHHDPALGRVLPWGLPYFEQNGAITYGVRSVFGYNPIENETYNAFITSYPDPRARIYDLLNVTTVATTTPLSLGEEDALALLAEESGVYLYERHTALPRAWFVSETIRGNVIETIAGINAADYDPRETAFVVSDAVRCSSDASGEVSVIQETANTLVAQTWGGGGLAIFSERHAPGWRATVDGEPVSVLRVNGLLRGVCVPPGEHTLTFMYRPPSLYAGGALSVVAVLLSLYVGWVYRPRSTSGEALSGVDE